MWKILREDYAAEPFVRIVKERSGIHRYPEPKLVAGTNWCDIGFERDPDSNRLVVVSAIDNLMKGAAGQAVQAFNVMHGFDETTGSRVSGAASGLTNRAVPILAPFDASGSPVVRASRSLRADWTKPAGGSTSLRTSSPAAGAGPIDHAPRVDRVTPMARTAATAAPPPQSPLP